jgi:hypothetical protein
MRRPFDTYGIRERRDGTIFVEAGAAASGCQG